MRYRALRLLTGICLMVALTVLFSAYQPGGRAFAEGGLKKDDWRLILVNKQHPIPEDYSFKLGTIKGSMKCDIRVIADLQHMLRVAGDHGIKLEVKSPYRNSERQHFLFERKIKDNMKDGLSYMEAYRKASQTVTIPGSSEHEIGLAIDIASDAYPLLKAGFADTEGGQWLADNAHLYGFTIRYPKGKEYITGIEFEPWHFRYVGREAARVLKENGWCLEELVDSLKS